MENMQRGVEFYLPADLYYHLHEWFEWDLSSVSQLFTRCLKGSCSFFYCGPIFWYLLKECMLQKYKTLNFVRQRPSLLVVDG